MLGALTAPIDRLTGLVQNRVEITGFGEHLQGAINGREPDLRAAPVHLVVELLRALESFGRVERLEDRRPLLGYAGPGCRFHSKASNATIVATPAIKDATWIADFIGSGSLCNSGIRSVLAM